MRVAAYGICDSITDMARSVLAAAPERFAVAGHSMGARVAMEIVRMAPKRVSRLALLDTGTHTVREGESEKRKKLVDLAYERGMGELAASWLPGMVDERRLNDRRLMGRLEAMIQRFTPEDYERQVGALLSRPDAAAHLAEITCPVLLGVGRNDRWSPLAQHREIAAQIPEAKLVVFEDSGHMSPIEAPEAVTRALSEWLRNSASPRNTAVRPSVQGGTALKDVDPFEKMVAEQNILRLIFQFAALNDAGEADALAALFTEDGVFARPSDPQKGIEGRSAIAAHFKERPPRNTRHLITNTVVDVLTASTAQARSCVVLFSGPKGDLPGPLNSIAVGEYRDELVKESDVWLFRKRFGSLQLRGDVFN